MSGQPSPSPAALACAHGALDQIEHVIDALEVAYTWNDDPLAAVAGTCPVPWDGPVPDKNDLEHEQFFAYRTGRELTFKGLYPFARETLGKGFSAHYLAEFLRTHATAHGLLMRGASMMSEHY